MPKPLEFVGKTHALSSAGMGAAAASLQVTAAEVWTVLAVETSGCGFLPDRRPQVLFERHHFHRHTGGRFGVSDISDPSAGGYGPGGANQHDRLAKAIALDRGAALKSASWGLGQIMGSNFAMAGFADVESFVAAMVDSEDAQLAAVAAFLRASKLDTHLRNHDWASFAAGYNGPTYARNRYDVKLAEQFKKISAGAVPDPEVRAAQLYLTFGGFKPGPVDGVDGSLTRSALASFQQQHGLAASGKPDAATLEALARVVLA